MQVAAPPYLRILRTKLADKQRRNPSYSLRSFARDLELPSGTLVSILSGKRGVPKARAGEICRLLRLPPNETRVFLNSLPRRGRLRDLERGLPDPGAASATTLDDTHHQILSRWEHFAILSLLETKTFRSDPAWIARRLNLPESVTRDAIDRLLECGLLGRGPEGHLEKRFVRLNTREDVRSLAVQESHRDTLRLAEDKLLAIPPELRDFSSITMAIDPELLPEAKALLREFRQKLSALLESGHSTEVYRLNLQLFPLTSPGTAREGEPSC